MNAASPGAPPSVVELMRLVCRLKNAAFTAGFEARGESWSRQDKDQAEVDAIEDAIERYATRLAQAPLRTMSDDELSKIFFTWKRDGQAPGGHMLLMRGVLAASVLPATPKDDPS